MPAEGDLRGDNLLIQADGAENFVPTAIVDFADPDPVTQFAHMELVAGQVLGELLYIDYHS